MTLVETHVSWVFLAGDFAYKVKKPVQLEFLDFSTLARRRHYCEEEFRLNRRFAPTLYLGLVRIARRHDGTLAIDGDGETVDWAVRMRRFDRAQELDRLIERSAVAPREIAELGARLARMHAEAAPAVDGMDWCRPERPLEAFRSAGHDLAELWPEAADRLAVLRSWAETKWRAVAARQRERRDSDAFRECHGDLHCANIVRIDGWLTPFDALEFDPSLSWIDPVNDLAFLSMDLDARGRPDLAAAVVDGWLACCGDYSGLAALKWFQCYRALVRALVNGLRARQRSTDEDAVAARMRYLQAAERHAAPARPSLIVMAGVSGSGKSWLAERLLAPLGAIRVRSDVERKRLAGLDALDPSGGAIYTRELTHRTYRRLEEAAGEILDAGYSAIVDAACLLRDERESLYATARSRGASHHLLWVHAPEEVLIARIMARRAAGSDASEATVDVLRAQQRFMEPPSREELAAGLSLDTGGDINVAAVAAALDQRGPSSPPATAGTPDQ